MTSLALAAVLAADIFTSYKALTTDLADRAANGAAAESLIADTQELIAQGAEVMQMYTDANPACADQLNRVAEDLEIMPTLTVRQIHTTYHDAVGIPAGPRHCYFGRALVVHPILNLVRFAEGLIDAERETVVDEFLEVGRHIARAKQNIDTPPH